MKKCAILSLILAIAPLLLGGCSLLGAKEDVVACPTTGIIKEASQMPLFDSPKAKTPKRAVEAAIVNFSGGCLEKTAGQLDMDLNVSFQGTDYQAAAQNDVYNFPYFIAVISPDQEILQRTAFSTNLHFDNTDSAAALPQDKLAKRQAVSTEEHHIRLPLTSGNSPTDYKVVIGFALSPEQLNYSKEHHVH